MTLESMCIYIRTRTFIETAEKQHAHACAYLWHAREPNNDNSGELSRYYVTLHT